MKDHSKVLKALGIIKKYLSIELDDERKSIDFIDLTFPEDDYTIIFCDTQEDYDLLKEILS